MPEHRVECCRARGPSLRRLARTWSGSWPLISSLFFVGPASMFWGATARATTPGFVALEYDVAPSGTGCPDTEEFRGSVQRLLGFDPFLPKADRLLAVQITRQATGFDGWIRWSDASGKWVGDRRLSSRRPDCAEIAHSVAFSVAVQIQLLATIAEALPERPPPSPPAQLAPPVVALAPAALSPPQPSTEARALAPESLPVPTTRRMKLFLGFGPSLALRLAPGPTGLGRLFVSGRLARFSFEIAFDAALPVKQHEVDGSGFTLGRFAAGAAACAHEGAIAACALAAWVLLRARGFDVDSPAAPVGLLSELGGRLAATRALGSRFFAAARVDAFVPLSTRSVTLNQAIVWTTPRLGVVVGMDVGLRVF